MKNHGYHNLLIPGDDTSRLSKLFQYEILDSPEEESFDKIALLAAQVFDTPYAFITFVDKERVFFKANISGLKNREMPRKHSLCSRAIMEENRVTVFHDTHITPELRESPMMDAGGGIRFYAGAAITTPDGFKLGNLCVLDEVPHELVSHKQRDMLQTLSEFVMNELDLRMVAKRAIKVHTELMNMTIHELKNPLSNIMLAANFIGMQLPGNAAITKMTEIISRNAGNMNDKLNDLLNLSQIEDEAFLLQLELFDLTELVSAVIDNFRIQANHKHQRLIMEMNNSLFIMADKSRIREVLDNLLSNAIKFAFPRTSVCITIKKLAGNAIIMVKDDGQGLTENDKSRLFIKFAKLSAVPTGKERSTGIGLSTVKILVELHKGKVWATSEGEKKGTSFFVSLPLPKN